MNKKELRAVECGWFFLLQSHAIHGSVQSILPLSPAENRPAAGIADAFEMVEGVFKRDLLGGPDKFLHLKEPPPPIAEARLLRTIFSIVLPPVAELNSPGVFAFTFRPRLNTMLT